MEIYIGLGFMFLCFSVLAGVIGYFGYQLHIAKEKIDISSKDDTNQSLK